MGMNDDTLKSEILAWPDEVVFAVDGRVEYAIKGVDIGIPLRRVISACLHDYVLLHRGDCWVCVRRGWDDSLDALVQLVESLPPMPPTANI